MASSKNRKAAALALAVVGVAGLSIASAATLNVGSAQLGAGQTIVASCQPTGTGAPAIAVNFTTEFSSSLKTYEAKSVELTNIAPACSQLKYKVTVNGTEKTGTLSTIAASSTGSLSVALPAATEAANITDVAVVIYS